MNRIATQPLRFLCALFALLLLASPAAHAQTGLYGGFNAAKINYPSNKWAYGGMFGIYSEFVKVPPVRVGADLRFSILRLDTNTNLFSTMIGPRFAFHPVGLSLTPYAEGLIGEGRYSFGNNVGSATKFQYEVLAGVDRPVVPHLDWRVLEFSYSGLSTVQRQNLHLETLSTGLVLRF